MKQEPEWIQDLQDLIRIDTSVPPGNNYDRALDFLSPRFEQAGCEVERVEIPRNLTKGFKVQRINLLAHRRSPGKPRLIIFTHIDTVPVRSWPGFTPRIEDGKIFGRGSADMKGAIIGLLSGLAKVRNKALAWDLTVMVTTDEEMLGQQAPQLEYLGQFLGPLTDAYIWSLDCEAGHVEIAGLGDLQMDIEVKGESCHAALSHRGENAVEKAVILMKAILELKESVENRRSKILVHPEVGLEAMVPRLNITTARGGWKKNVIPGACSISLDRRLIPEENLETAERELIDCLTRVENVRWEIKKLLKVPPYTIDPEDPVVNLLSETLENVTGQTGKFGGMGSSDLPGVAQSIWHCKVFGFGVFRPENNIHGRKEFVYVKDIEDLSKVTTEFLLRGRGS